MPALAQQGKNLGLHGGEFGLEHADLVAARGGRDDERGIFGRLAIIEDTGREPADGADENARDEQIEHQRRHQRDDEGNEEGVARIGQQFAAQGLFGHEHLDQRLAIEARVPLAHDAQGAVAAPEQGVERTSEHAERIAAAHVDGDRQARHGRLLEFEQLALRLAAIDDGGGAGRIEQPVGQLARQGHDVGHGIEHAGGDDAHLQAVFQPGGAEAGGRWQENDHLDGEDHRNNRCNDLARQT